MKPVRIGDSGPLPAGGRTGLPSGQGAFPRTGNRGLRSGAGLLQIRHRMADKLTYKEAGVDTVKAAALVGDIRSHVQRTQRQR